MKELNEYELHAQSKTCYKTPFAHIISEIVHIVHEKLLQGIAPWLEL
jgi:hypothetical protein